MLSRVPRKFKDAGAPKLLSFSLCDPPYVAVCIGENYMLVFGTSGQQSNEDVGLTFPDDYGPITGFQWMVSLAHRLHTGSRARMSRLAHRRARVKMPLPVSALAFTPPPTGRAGRRTTWSWWPSPTGM